MPIAKVNNINLFYTDSGSGFLYCSKLPHVELVIIKNSRHATPLDQADALNQICQSFLTAVSDDN